MRWQREKLTWRHLLGTVLVSFGASIDARDKITHLTALHYAVSKNYPHVVSYLLGAGADPNEAPNDGNSEEEGCGSDLTMIGEQPPEVSDVGLAGAATNDSIDSSERTEATSSSDPADESDEDGGMSSAELTRCAG